MKILTDEVDQESAGLDICRCLLPVDCHRDFHKEVPFVENLAVNLADHDHRVLGVAVPFSCLRLLS
jgi:hypothetical protein